MQNLNSLLYTFEKSIGDLLEPSTAITPAEAYRLLAKRLEECLPVAIQIGEAANLDVVQTGIKDRGDHLAFVTSYLWTGKAKDFFLLWRNVLLQLIKAEILLMDDEIEEVHLDQLVEESKKRMYEAFQALKGFAPLQSHNLKKTKKEGRAQIDRWKLQDSPWSIYEGQFEALLKQAVDIQQIRKELLTHQKNLQQIKKLTLDGCEQIRVRAEEYQLSAQEAQNFVQDYLAGQPQRVASHLGDMVESLSHTDEKAEFHHRLEELLDTFKTELKVPYLNQRQEVVEKLLDFRKNTSAWLESEILPGLHELWLLQDMMGNAIRVSSVNVRNRALILASSEDTDEPAPQVDLELTQPLKAFLTKSESQLKEIKAIQRTIKRRLELRFRMSKIFDSSNLFLTSPFQRTLSPINLDRNPLFKNARSWLKTMSKRIQQLQRTIEREDKLSDQEKILRFIRSQELKAKNHSYTNIFKTREYIGESFCVGRDNELEHCTELVLNWRDGFMGSLLLHGQRFSGKTFMGEIISHHLFPNNTIRLLPDRSLSWQGRTLQTTRDLGTALGFLKKYSSHEETFLWIDDLETWSSTEFSLSANTGELLQFLSDPSSSSLFVAVSMSNWMLDHLQCSHDIRQAFQGNINLDKMSLSEVQSAIAIRHGATHKVLVDGEGHEIGASEFNKMTTRIYRNTEGNIGEALNQWAAHAKVIDEDHVTLLPLAEVRLPDFINPDDGLILTSILKYKKLNEYRLRKIFGPSFSAKYKIIILRLLNLGILRRDSNGYLELNESVANLIGKALEKKKFLKFYSQH